MNTVRSGWKLGMVAMVMASAGCAKPAVTPPEVAVAPPPAARASSSANAPIARVAKAEPTLFGELFQSGRVFRYRVEQESSYYDPADAKANAAGYVGTKETSEIACAVGDVRDLPLASGGMARAAKLDCGSGNQIGGGGATVAGIYVLGPRGIHRYALETSDADMAEVPEDQALLLEREPVPSKKVDEGEDHTSTTEVSRDASGAWCKASEVLFGDYFAEADCFELGRGLVSARREVSGGSTFIATFTAL